MRKIKFRVWNKEKQKFVGVDDKSILLSEYGSLRTIDRWGNLGSVNKESYKLNFFTGLKDKEGKEIYEGDIVEGLVMFQNNLMEVKGVIKFIHGRFVIAEYNCSLYKFSNAQGNQSNEITVIGNKYENPKLLGGE